MNAIDINNKLRVMYTNHLKHFNKAVDIRKYKTPMLMECTQDYVDKDNIRILFVDSVSKSWDFKADFFNDDNGYEVDKIIDKYSDYCWPDEIKRRSISEEMINKVNRILNPSKKKNYLCTSLFKFNSPSEKNPLRNIKTGRYSTDIDAEYNYDILNHEIEIVKPDFVFFLTGSYYDYCFQKMFGENIFMVKIAETPTIARVKCFGKSIRPIYRLPNPYGKDKLIDNRTILKTVLNLVIYTDLSLYGNILKEPEYSEL